MDKKINKEPKPILTTYSVKCPMRTETLIPIDGECLTLAIITYPGDIVNGSVRLPPDDATIYQVIKKCPYADGASKDRKGFLNGVLCHYNEHL